MYFLRHHTCPPVKNAVCWGHPSLIQSPPLGTPTAHQQPPITFTVNLIASHTTRIQPMQRFTRLALVSSTGGVLSTVSQGRSLVMCPTQPQLCRHTNHRQDAGASNANQKVTLKEDAPYTPIYAKPFPVRAAIEVGCGGLATLAVGRVDARQGALKELLFQNQLPLDISVVEHDRDGVGHRDASPSSSSTSLSTNVESRYKSLSPETIRDVFDQVRQLLLSLQNVHNSVSVAGISEFSGLLTWPFYDCPRDQMRDLASALTKEFKVDFRVLGMHEGGSGVAPGSERMRALLDRVKNPKGLGGAVPGTNLSSSTPSEATPPLSPPEILETLTFFGYATAAKIQDWDRLLIVTEDPEVTLQDGTTSSVAAAPGSGHMYTGGDIHIIGTATPTRPEEDLGATPRQRRTLADQLKGLKLRRYTIPFRTTDVLQMMLQNVQRRDPVNLHAFSSPNPVLRSEAEILRKALFETLEEDLPEWVVEKLAEGALVVGASENGGLLNTAARIAGRVHVGTERIEQATDYGLCGLTDVLIGHTYKHPSLVVPQSLLCSALMRAFRVGSLEYVPQVSIAQALLVHPSFWTYNRRELIAEELGNERWFNNLHDRSYNVPHQARSPTNPNIAPQYTNSTKDGLGAPYYTSY